MKRILHAVFMVVLASVLTGCSIKDSGWTLSPYYQSTLSDADSARLMAVDDKLIVPGERIGPVFLEMTDKQLFQKMGNSIESHAEDLTRVKMVYTYKDISAVVKQVGHIVTKTFATGPTYAMANGLSTGSSEADVKAKLGQPVSEVASFDCSAGHYCTEDGKATMKLCYSTGLTVITVKESATAFYVTPPGTCE